MSSPSLAVFGLGNVLLHDDAFGPWVIRELTTRWKLDERIVVEDLGTPGLELSTHLAGHQCVILLDAIAATEPPGTLLILDRQEILRHPTGIRLGPHDPSLAETVLTMDLVDDGPGEVILVGAVPVTTEPGVGLSDAVRPAIGEAASVVGRLLRSRGFTAVSIDEAADVAPWWESEITHPAWCSR